MPTPRDVRRLPEMLQLPTRTGRVIQVAAIRGDGDILVPFVQEWSDHAAAQRALTAG